MELLETSRRRRPPRAVFSSIQGRGGPGSLPSVAALTLHPAINMTATAERQTSGLLLRTPPGPMPSREGRLASLHHFQECQVVPVKTHREDDVKNSPPQQHRREPACLLEWVASAQSPQDSPSRRMGPNSGSCSRGLVFLPTKPERGRLFPALSDEIARSWTSGPCCCLKSDQSIASPMGLGEMVALNQPCRAVSPGVQAAAITNGYRGAGFGSIAPANSTQTPMEERSTTSDFIDNTLFTPPRQVTMSSTSNGRG